MGVDLAPICIRHAESLHRSNDDAGASLQVGRCNLCKIRNVQNPEPTVERGAQGLIVWMTWLLQRLESLTPDRITRHKPQDDRKFPLQIGISCNFYCVSGKQGFAAAG